MVHVSLTAGLSKAGKWSRGPREAWLWSRASWVIMWGCSSASLHAHPATHLPYFASSFAQGWTKDAQGALDRGMLHRALTSASLEPTSLHTVDAPWLLDNESWQRGAAFARLMSSTKAECGGAPPEPNNHWLWVQKSRMPAGWVWPGCLWPTPTTHQQHQWSMDKARRLGLGQWWKPARKCQRRLECQQEAEGKYLLSPGLDPYGRLIEAEQLSTCVVYWDILSGTATAVVP